MAAWPPGKAASSSVPTTAAREDVDIVLVCCGAQWLVVMFVLVCNGLQWCGNGLMGAVAMALSWCAMAGCEVCCGVKWAGIDVCPSVLWLALVWQRVVVCSGDSFVVGL